ncbi:MAG: hypothetical protein HY554_05235, partial [Elusimicrobia bacterium]|nr:hypothetical protein [Elusimicrobiota bacterium]
MKLTTAALLPAALSLLLAANGAAEDPGIDYRLENGWATVITVRPDSPAARAGVRAKDRVWKVGGVELRLLEAKDVRVLLDDPGTGSVVWSLTEPAGAEFEVAVTHAAAGRPAQARTRSTAEVGQGSATAKGAPPPWLAGISAGLRMIDQEIRARDAASAPSAGTAGQGAGGGAQAKATGAAPQPSAQAQPRLDVKARGAAFFIGYDLAELQGSTVLLDRGGEQAKESFLRSLDDLLKILGSESKRYEAELGQARRLRGSAASASDPRQSTVERASLMDSLLESLQDKQDFKTGASWYFGLGMGIRGLMSRCVAKSDDGLARSLSSLRSEMSHGPADAPAHVLSELKALVTLLEDNASQENRFERAHAAARSVAKAVMTAGAPPASAAVGPTAPAAVSPALHTEAYPDGKKYIGEWANRGPHGQGILYWPNGGLYIGAFDDGYIDGYGILVTKYGMDVAKIYSGFWRKGHKTGFGIEAYGFIAGVKGPTYVEGEWTDDACTGACRTISTEGPPGCALGDCIDGVGYQRDDAGGY